ncbi:Sec-independent protein translocase subunit TatA [Streptomyces sp. NPDC004658]|uniref:Sec-independent protein translocase subunit TatA n=1 Tax=Streptomyces sp. NPDC004658 TaxID=3154672 RepID=UPI0033BC043B
MFRSALEPWHLLVLAAVVITLFSSKRLPETARALGRSMRILKSETKAMKDDGAPDEARPEPEPAPGPRTAPDAATARTTPTDGPAGHRD